MLVSIGVSALNQIIGHIFMMQYVFLQFRVLIRVLELDFSPESLQRFIYLIKIDTLYSWKECVSVNWRYWYKSLNWTYLYDADVFLQFRV